MSMIKITSNSREYLAALNRIEGAMQKVTAETLTETAQAVTKRAERNIRGKLIVRTPYTLKSLVTYKASASKPIDRQNSVSGTKSEYLPVQDTGGVIKAKKKVIAVPTNTVRGKDRKKRIAKKYKLGADNKAFVLKPGKTLQRTALFVRQGKRIIKIRDLQESKYTLKPVHWHTDAVKEYGNYAFMSKAFARQAARYLKSSTITTR